VRDSTSSNGSGRVNALNSPERLGATLYTRALRGGVWTVVAHSADTFTRIISSLLMTRLLFPEAFGLITAATSLLVGLTLVSDVGIRTVILRSPHGDNPDFLRFAWTLQICRGGALWAVLILFCGVLTLEPVRSSLPNQSVFADKEFPIISVVLGFSLLLSGLESTAVHANVRRLNLRPIIFLDVIARLASLPVMLLLAWMTKSVWAIVAGVIVASIVRLIMTHLFVPGPRMCWRWDREHVAEFAHFGKWISIASTATFVSGQGDRLFIGLFLSSTLLGLYSIAKLPMETAMGLFERLNGSLAVPVLGEVIRTDVNSLKGKYYRFRLPFDLSAPLLGGIVCSAGSLIIHILYDARYVDAGYMLQLLGVSLAMYPSSLILSAFPLTGSPQVSAVISVVQAVSLLTCMVAGFVLEGLPGVVFGIAIHRIVPSILVLELAYRRGWVDILKELRVLPVFGLGIFIGNGLLAVAQYLFES
jgi:O-antigen/teichoic acid export membrane protein